MYVGKSEEGDQKMQRSANGIEQFGKELKKVAQNPVYSVARDSRWSIAMYRDDMHPTAEGNKVLANIINKPELNDAL